MTAAKQDFSEASISAVVIRKDGKTEDLGEISYWHKSRRKRWLWKLKQQRRFRWLR